MFRRWVYCKLCGFQADSPLADDERPAGGLCPSCAGEGLMLLTFTRREWMQHGSDLLAGTKTLHELLLSMPVTTAGATK